MDADGNQDVLSMLRTVLVSFGDRVRVSGHSVGVTPEAAAKLALIFHELGTNAVKYGSLSATGGSVGVSVSMEGESLVIDWREKGGPPVETNPSRRGFGSRLLENSLSAGTGSVEITFSPLGLIARVALEKSQLANLIVT